MSPLETFAMSKAVKNVNAACSDITGLRIMVEHAIEALEALGDAAPAASASMLREALSGLLVAATNLTAVRRAVKPADEAAPVMPR